MLQLFGEIRKDFWIKGIFELSEVGNIFVGKGLWFFVFMDYIIV